MLLWLLLFNLVITINETCYDSDDCNDDIWCNGQEQCINNTCINDDDSPCNSLFINIKNINKNFGHKNFKVICYEKEHRCEWVFRCFSDNDCDDNFFCNGLETCDLTTGLCLKSSLNNSLLCQHDEICNHKYDKCLKINTVSSTNNTLNIVITILISIIIIILITFLFIVVISLYIFK